MLAKRHLQGIPYLKRPNKVPQEIVECKEEEKNIFW